MKFLFDLFPVLLFFGAYSLSKDIFTATATAILATLAQVVYCLVRHRKVDTMLWVNLALITVFGGATLLFHNKTFIFWKPTALYWLFALALLGFEKLRQVNLIEKVMGAQLKLPAAVWKQLLQAWAGFFIAMGFVNLFVVYLVEQNQVSENFWVNFKLFGTLGLTVAFVIAQSVYLSRFMEPEQ